MDKILGFDLPEILTEEETIKYLNEYKNGSEKAREILITHNLKYVLKYVYKNHAIRKDKDELVMVGIIGLIKAVDNYDLNKGVKFITFASKCIENEILMYFRKEIRHMNLSSFDEILESNVQEIEINAITKSDYNSDIEEQYEEKETIAEIQEIINCLSENDKLLYELYFVKKLTQNEIASFLNVTQPVISRKIKKLIEKIKTIAIKDEVIQIPKKR